MDLPSRERAAGPWDLGSQFWQGLCTTERSSRSRRGALSAPGLESHADEKRKWQPVGESNPSFQVENLTS